MVDLPEVPEDGGLLQQKTNLQCHFQEKENKVWDSAPSSATSGAGRVIVLNHQERNTTTKIVSTGCRDIAKKRRSLIHNKFQFCQLFDWLSFF